MRLRLGCLATLIALSAVPASAHAAPPEIDDYLGPAETNTPGTAFPDGAVRLYTIPGTDSGVIDDATVETTGMGDASDTNEDLECTSPPAPMTKTVWYWTFPHVSGWLSVKTDGGDAVVRLLTVTPGPGYVGNNTPLFGDSACSDDPINTSSEELFAGVVGGPNRRYAIQVGVYDDDPTFGARGAGQHQTTIRFFHDRDLDSTFDANDRCPTTVGPASTRGCPDSDGDGLVNIDDRCPTARGSAGACVVARTATATASRTWMTGARRRARAHATRTATAAWITRSSGRTSCRCRTARCSPAPGAGSYATASGSRGSL